MIENNQKRLKKEDFILGQKVGLIYYSRSGTEISLTGTVTTVGNKYLTIEVDKNTHVRFNMKENFLQATDYSPEYWLFRTEEEACAALKRSERLKEVRTFRKWELLSDDELRKVYEIVKVER